MEKHLSNNQEIEKMNHASRSLIGVLKRHVDIPLTMQDIEEMSPSVDWRNQFNNAWGLLMASPNYNERLRSLDADGETLYVLLSNPDDYTPIHRSSVNIGSEKDSKLPNKSEKIVLITSLAVGSIALIGSLGYMLYGQSKK